MTIAELLVGVLIVFGLAILRFGLPMLVMWLINLGCCRLLHLKQT